MTVTVPSTDGLVHSHVEHVMGTVFSFDLRDGVPASVLAAVVADLHRIDRVFSTWRPDSDISRLDRGEISIGEADPDVATVLALGAHSEDVSAGAFCLRPAGRLDPSAVVKGWAVERAYAALVAAGAERVAVGGGGDVRVGRAPSPRTPWRIGIVDPDRPRSVLRRLHLQDAAVATSGTAERGDHLIDPRIGRAATGLRSLTLIGPELTSVDALSTAAFVMGADAREFVEALGPEFGGFAVGVDGGRWESSTLARWTAG